MGSLGIDERGSGLRTPISLRWISLLSSKTRSAARCEVGAAARACGCGRKVLPKFLIIGLDPSKVPFRLARFACSAEPHRCRIRLEGRGVSGGAVAWPGDAVGARSRPDRAESGEVREGEPGVYARVFGVPGGGEGSRVATGGAVSAAARRRRVTGNCVGKRGRGGGRLSGEESIEGFLSGS